MTTILPGQLLFLSHWASSSSSFSSSLLLCTFFVCLPSQNEWARSLECARWSCCEGRQEYTDSKFSSSSSSVSSDHLLLSPPLLPPPPTSFIRHSLHPSFNFLHPSFPSANFWGPFASGPDRTQFGFIKSVNQVWIIAESSTGAEGRATDAPHHWAPNPGAGQALHSPVLLTAAAGRRVAQGPQLGGESAGTEFHGGKASDNKEPCCWSRSEQPKGDQIRGNSLADL